MDKFTPEERSLIMSKIRGKNTKCELLAFAYLRKNGVYFQKHYRRAPGSPDIALPRKKRAVFIEGDFWHGRDFDKRKDKLPDFWKAKIIRNMERDRKNLELLAQQGWSALRVWESEIIPMKKREEALKRIKDFLTDIQ